MKIRSFLSIVLFVSLLISAPGFASEVRGSFWGYKGAQIPSGATIEISCTNMDKKVTTLNSNGSYSIRGLPSSRGCTYLLKFPDGSVSKSTSFNSGSGVVKISGELRKHKGQILVIPK